MSHITILHNNDMHGDWLPQEVDGMEIGGLARLAGYIKHARKENPNTLYVIAGDMFRGSIIDQEYLGMSTIDMVNMLRPNVVALGNHEVDYGLAHLLFLEKCAYFPIVNSDLFVTTNNKRLFNPYLNLEIDGVKIMFIAVLTNEVLVTTRAEKVIGSFVNMKNARKEIGVICDNYRTEDTDLTILLTHIGYENDLALANELDPTWGIDMIIGGHSHTYMDKPTIVNGIPIVQAYTGTDYIGRFDIEYDKENKTIADWQWQAVPITQDTSPSDPVMEEVVDGYKALTDRKYHRVVTRFRRMLTHPSREQETELGNLYADLMVDESSFDIMMFGSGAIRKKEFGPVVEYQDILENTPFDSPVWMIYLSGKTFRKVIMHLMRDEAWVGETEFFQFSKGVHIKYNRTTHELEEFSFRGKPVEDEETYSIAIQHYHYSNIETSLGITLEDASMIRKPKVVASSVNNIIEEYFATHQDLDSHVEGRIEIVD